MDHISVLLLTKPATEVLSDYSYKYKVSEVIYLTEDMSYSIRHSFDVAESIKIKN